MVRIETDIGRTGMIERDRSRTLCLAIPEISPSRSASRFHWAAEWDNPVGGLLNSALMLTRHDRSRRPIMVTVLLLLHCALVPLSGDGQESQTIKVPVQLVNLTATVEDEQGHSVADLRQEDFTIFEDGRQQQIAVFHDDEKVPVSLGILFDTSGSMIDKIDGVQDAVVHFIATTDRDDDIFLIRFSTYVSVVQDFTDDRRRLQRAVRNLRPGGSTALYDAVVRGLEHLQGGRHKKKALVLVTDGNDTSSEASLKDVTATAQQAEATVYALGIGHGEQGSFGHLEGLFEDKVNVEALHSITDVTGGRTVLLEGALHQGKIDRIDQAVQGFSDELRKQYTIGYYPTNKERDGRFRHIQIRSRDPSYTVRTREGYFAPRE